MDDQILVIYCLADDVAKALGHIQDPQCRMSDAEVLTTAIVAARFFGGNVERARWMLGTRRYIPRMLSRSRLNRRLHAIRDLAVTMLVGLGETFKQLNASSHYIIDSFPVPCCDNIRIKDTCLYRNAADTGPDPRYRGYTASKRRYFFGVKLFLMVTAQGQPVEMFLTPGSTADVAGLDVFGFDLPGDSRVFADSAFTVYEVEDLLLETNGIELKPMRKKNSKRAVSAATAYLQAVGRKMVETAGSMLERLLPKSIHAVTSAGFELKVMFFVLAYAVSCTM